MNYSPPLQAQLFLLEDVLHWEQLFQLPQFSHADSETAKAVLTEGARFVSEVLAPINQPGDKQGSRFEDNRVITPAGFREAFQHYAEGGWPGLDLPEAYGGQDLPLTVQAAFAEMVNGACVAFGMFPIMLRAAAWLLIEHASDELIESVVPNLTAGKWGASICITEAQAGSDVGNIHTQATPDVHGIYKLTGSKIFISYGDHDLTSQIVHLVLARTVDAPAGSRGLSLFLAPKYLFTKEKKMNSISVSRIEEKMGLHASPTCVLNLDGATAYPIGPLCQGLNCMFTMVNLMRLEVAVQGVAIAGAAIQKALSYTAERRQGGKPGAPQPIIEHADVRRTLFIMRARCEAMRALVYETAFNLDLARAAESEQQRSNAKQLAEFLLPVCKTCAAEMGFAVASHGLQLFGGHGYVCDAGIEQYLRDSRVMAIYEGTSGIQALDLVTRKLLKDEGRRYQIFIDRVVQDIANNQTGEEEKIIANGLAVALASLQRSTESIKQQSLLSMRDVEAAATDYIHLVGLVAGAWMWLRMVSVTGGDPERSQGRQAYGKFYVEYLLPEAAILEQRIVKGADTLDSIGSDIIAKND